MLRASSADRRGFAMNSWLCGAEFAFTRNVLK
jgi:hypothetical protein